MASEITVNGSLAYADSEDADEILSIADLVANISTKKYTKNKQAIGITEEAIKLGEVSGPAWAIFINRDTTNYIELKVATSGAIFAKLLAGEFALLRLGSGAAAPFAIANTAPCQMEFMILDT